MSRVSDQALFIVFNPEPTELLKQQEEAVLLSDNYLKEKPSLVDGFSLILCSYVLLLNLQDFSLITKKILSVLPVTSCSTFTGISNVENSFNSVLLPSISKIIEPFNTTSKAGMGDRCFFNTWSFFRPMAITLLFSVFFISYTTE